MIVSIHGEKAFHTGQHPFMTKILSEGGKEEPYLNIIKDIYRKPTADIILNRKKIKPFPLNWVQGKGVYFHHFCLTSIGISSHRIQARKNVNEIGKEEVKLIVCR